MNEIIDKVEFFTERDRLDRKTRQREIVYKRAYLMYVLRNQLLTFQEIGDRFNVTHPTVLYWSNIVKFYLHTSKDQVYIDHIQEYLKAFEGTKYTPDYRNLTEEQAVAQLIKWKDNPVEARKLIESNRRAHDYNFNLNNLVGFDLNNNLLIALM
mgnify:CR=1 FL=1